ncbi:MAG TPA: phosphoenolpyruvate synthase [Acidobacteriota bacterium]|nr:phosphoenolpyruvate synthase [Acidobacteriota bacterium]
MSEYILWFQELGMDDVPRVGGKNASLGEMISNLSGMGLKVPRGFATTASAYREFLAQGGLDQAISRRLRDLDIEDVDELSRRGAAIRQMILETPFPARLEEELFKAYQELGQACGVEDLAVAVRSSATAEDLPEASFAGQQETFLNVRDWKAVKQAVHEVFASLFNDRAIAYRVHHGFEHAQVALSAGIQRMVRSDIGSSGVAFSIDTESGFDQVVFITSSYGLGETVVQGQVNPDEFYVYKPSLRRGKKSILRRGLGSKAVKMVYAQDGKSLVRTVDVPQEDQGRFSLDDQEVEHLARQTVQIEDHYGRPMDVEWAKDGEDGCIYILQARPETVQSRAPAQALERYQLKEKGPVLAEGRSIGQRIGAGRVRVVRGLDEMSKVEEGDVLVTDMTDPDWEPVMKRSAAIVTNRGGRTCHAAIIARELGVPAVVGTGDATEALPDGAQVTVSCAEGDTAFVYEGLLDFEVTRTKVDEMPELPFKIMMNVGNPERAFDFQATPHRGVGLARLEFIIARMIGVHPKALLEYESLPEDLRRQVGRCMAGYAGPVEFYVERLAEGIATIAAAFAPYPVIVRLSDFKSNEYANLLGGDRYEPDEENPMLGFRGASRYVADSFRDCFELECRAVKQVREEMGLDNVEVMIPFVRTVKEGREVIDLLARNGLRRGEKGLRVIMMCELPSNALLAEEFLDHFDGFSIGSNDLTQLTLGLDRDSGLVAEIFDERNPAVLSLMDQAIKACRGRGKYIGICGQGPSDHPDLARWLMERGIDSVSLNPDTVVDTWLFLARQSAQVE